MTQARYFVFPHGASWLVTLDGELLGRHSSRAAAVRSASVMADLMGSMRHEADVVVEADGELQLAWTYGTDPLASAERAA